MGTTTDYQWRWDWWNCPYNGRVLSEVIAEIPKNAMNGSFYMSPERFSKIDIFITFSIVLLAIRMLTKRYIFPPIAVYFGIPREKTMKLQKFSYQLWLACYYTTVTVINTYYMRVLPWGRNPLECASQVSTWDGYPHKDIPESFHYFYLAQGAFYLSEFVATLVEPRRSDFAMYIWHHSVTIYLILGSYLSYQHRVGSVVLFVHDIPDIFLSVAKVFHYIRYDKCCNTSFIGLAVSYFVCRLYMFPGIIYSGWKIGMFNTIPNTDNLYLSLMILLTFGLLPLHVIWYWMILKTAKRALSTDGVEQDSRSDDENDEDRAGKRALRKKKKKN